jgi:arsenate reductase (thioredoxin)
VIPAGKKKVLFVCIGNACRSQMAEGFARALGGDVIIPASAGLSPAHAIAPDTLRAMDERMIDLRDQFPKNLRQLGRPEFDIVVNMTGFFLPMEFKGRIIDWEVADPVFMSYAGHCLVRDQIQKLVMELVVDLRVGPPPQFRGQGSGRLEL